MKRHSITRFTSFLLSLFAVIGLCLQPVSAAEMSFADIDATLSDIIVLYTNDVHGGISDNSVYTGTDKSLGYAGLAAVKAEAEKEAAGVVLVDNGDSIQGAVFDTLSNGVVSLDLMEKLPYDICIPGNHEFDFGVDPFLEEVKKHEGLNYICANFTDQEGNLLFDKGYVVKEFEVEGHPVKIAFVGIDTPESISKGTPKAFMNDDKKTFKYTFNADTPEQFYNCIQKSIDAARAEANYVIVMGHLGDQGITDGWSSQEVIENTHGIDVFLDGHAHSVIESEEVENKNGQNVLLTSTGTKLEHIGCLKLSVKDGKIASAESKLINKITDQEKESEAYKAMDEEVKKVEEEYAFLAEVVGQTDFPLCIYDPENSDERLVRVRDTNMGDFLTDGYVWASTNLEKFEEADLSLLNGGSIRANINEGEVTYTNVLSVFPWYTHVTEIKATGQQIVDCLEMGARKSPKESGGFMVGGNLKYKIDLNKDSKIVEDEKGMFVSVDGKYDEGDYRVYDVTIKGQPVDLEKEYKLVINDYYYSNCGDGMTMFKDDEAIVHGDDNVIDMEVICEFFKAQKDMKVPEKYQNPYGDGRIETISKVEVASEDANSALKDVLMASELKIKEDSIVGFELTSEEASVLNSDNLYCVRIAKDQLPEQLANASKIYAVSQEGMTPVLCEKDANGDLMVNTTVDSGSIVLGVSNAGGSNGGTIAIVVVIIAAVVGIVASKKKKSE